MSEQKSTFEPYTIGKEAVKTIGCRYSLPKITVLDHMANDASTENVKVTRSDIMEQCLDYAIAHSAYKDKVGKLEPIPEKAKTA